jgi:hypothetical protein
VGYCEVALRVSGVAEAFVDAGNASALVPAEEEIEEVDYTGVDNMDRRGAEGHAGMADRLVEEGGQSVRSDDFLGQPDVQLDSAHPRPVFVSFLHELFR